MTLLKTLIESTSKKAKKVKKHRKLKEAVAPVDPTMGLDQQLEVLEQRLAAAKRGLGFANKLKNPIQKKKHMGLVLTNLNKIRGQLGRVMAAIADQEQQFARAEQDYEQMSDLE
jgi:phosphoenolpyruvate carboxylase